MPEENRRRARIAPLAHGELRIPEIDQARNRNHVPGKRTSDRKVGRQRSGSIQGESRWCSFGRTAMLVASPSEWSRDEHLRDPECVDQGTAPQPGRAGPRRCRRRPWALLRHRPDVLPDRLCDPDARRRRGHPALRRRLARDPGRGRERLDRVRGPSAPPRPALAPGRRRPGGDRARLAVRAGGLLAQQRFRVDAATARRAGDHVRAAPRPRPHAARRSCNVRGVSRG